MKRKILSLILFILIIISSQTVVLAGNVAISDANLRTALYLLTGTPGNESLTTDKLAAVAGDVDLSNRNISDISGIHYLTGATSIDLSLNNISSVPREIEQLTSLKSLDLSGNRITRIPSNVGGMLGLKNLDIRANRLETITSALTKISFDNFKCDYNFLDLSEGSSDLSTIYQISAQNKEYMNQLSPITNFSAYSPVNGTIVLYWDKVSSIIFDNGAVGEISRFSVLDSNYSYLGEAIPGETTYEISGLNTGTDYKYYVGAEYNIRNTKYSGIKNKVYSSIELKPIPLNTPMVNITPSATPTISPTPISETATIKPVTATPDSGVTATIAPAQTSVPTEAPKKTSGAINAIYIIIAILVVVFVFITILIVGRALSQRNNRNSRYRR